MRTPTASILDYENRSFPPSYTVRVTFGDKTVFAGVLVVGRAIVRVDLSGVGQPHVKRWWNESMESPNTLTWKTAYLAKRHAEARVRATLAGAPLYAELQRSECPADVNRKARPRLRH